jgi:lysyl-tRNA synthetase class 2
MLQTRAKLLRSIREFFWQRDILEVDTQALSLASISDPHIEVLTTKAKCLGKEHTYYLQSSPEFAMKRLLAAGSACIYQMAKVFRLEENSKRHSIEFTLLEWYRIGLDDWQLMAEVEELLISVSQDASLRCDYKSYQDAFLTYADLDPFEAELSQLQQLAHQHTEYGLEETDRDALLDLIFNALIEPKIGADRPCFIHSYPASQAALAKTKCNFDGLETAKRFELYWRGMELANGYHELTDEQEQARRFDMDNQLRKAQGKVVRAQDQNLLAALASGLPNCAGVALGVDRLLMVLSQSQDIQEVMPYAKERV